MKRRHFLVATTAAGLSSALALWFRARGGETSLANQATLGVTPGLEPQPAPTRLIERAREPLRLERDPRGLLDLPPGFRYRIIERAGDVMSDGYRVPARPDAMACFPLADGRYALMRNHELDGSLMAYGACARPEDMPDAAYDKTYAGGVTRVVVDRRGRRLSSNLVLVGTARNCAGGMSPWGWMSCEESAARGHGYVFLCSPQADSVQPPKRITRYGRFMHEAVAIDVADHAAYLTEDRVDGCLYRFLPAAAEAPFGPGKLSALAVAGRPRFDLGQGLAPGAQFEVRWVDVPPEAGERGDALRYAAHQAGAAVLRRGEGIWAMQDGFALTCTSGGAAGLGQIFHLAPTRHGGTLRLLAESSDRSWLNMPDNLTVTPWGDLLVCEDNTRAPYLRLVTRDGEVLPFAFNAASRSELAGVCFSPDGQLLFVNIQENGLTLAIQGPWDNLGSTG